MEKNPGLPEGVPSKLKMRDAPSNGDRTTEGLEIPASAYLRPPPLTLTSILPDETPLPHNPSPDLGMKGFNIGAPLSPAPKAGTNLRGGKPPAKPRGKRHGLPVAQVPEGGNPLEFMKNQGGGARTVLKGAQSRPVPRGVQEADRNTALYKRAHLNSRAEDVLGIVGDKYEIPSLFDREQRRPLPGGTVCGQGPSHNLSRAAPGGAGMHAPIGVNVGNWPPHQRVQYSPARVSPVAGMAPGVASPVTPPTSYSPGPTGSVDSGKRVVTPSSVYSHYLFPQEVPSPQAGLPLAESSPPQPSSPGAVPHHLFPQEVRAPSSDGRNDMLPEGNEEEDMSMLMKMFPLSRDLVYAGYVQAERNVDEAVVILSTYEHAPEKTNTDPVLAELVEMFCEGDAPLTTHDCADALEACGNDHEQAVNRLMVLKEQVSGKGQRDVMDLGASLHNMGLVEPRMPENADTGLDFHSSPVKEMQSRGGGGRLAAVCSPVKELQRHEEDARIAADLAADEAHRKWQEEEDARVAAEIANTEEQRKRQEEDDARLAAEYDPMQRRQRQEEEDARLAAEVARGGGLDSVQRLQEAQGATVLSMRDRALASKSPSPVRGVPSTSSDGDTALAWQLQDEEDRTALSSQSHLPAGWLTPPSREFDLQQRLALEQSAADFGAWQPASHWEDEGTPSSATYSHGASSSHMGVPPRTSPGLGGPAPRQLFPGVDMQRDSPLQMPSGNFSEVKHSSMIPAPSATDASRLPRRPMPRRFPQSQKEDWHEALWKKWDAMAEAAKASWEVARNKADKLKKEMSDATQDVPEYKKLAEEFHAAEERRTREKKNWEHLRAKAAIINNAKYREPYDLHNLTVDQAMRRVKKIIAYNRDEPEYARIEFVTGKGNHSVGNFGVIRDCVHKYLQEENIPFTEAPHGGALFIYIDAFL